MYKSEYAPRAMDDMARIKEYITLQHGANVAGKSLRRSTSSARQLEKFPEEGPGLEELILVSTDYRYLYIKPNYLFYRIEYSTQEFPVASGMYKNWKNDKTAVKFF